MSCQSYCSKKGICIKEQCICSEGNNGAGCEKAGISCGNAEYYNSSTTKC